MPITIHNHVIDKLAVAAGFVSGFALLPQVIHMMYTGSPDYSMVVTYAVLFLNSIIWLLYSMHRALLALAVPSIINIIVTGVAIAWVLFY